MSAPQSNIEIITKECIDLNSFMMVEKEHILGSYRKLKSYIFYSKSHSYLYKEIAEFESNNVDFYKCIENITCALNVKNDDFFERLIARIETIPVIKSIEPQNNDDNNLFTNDISKPSKTVLTGVNFFIKCPVELLIIDTLWTLLCLAIIKKNGDFKYCYANSPARDLILNSKSSLLERINFKSLSIYEPYFEKYKLWQNTIVEKALERKKRGEDSKLVSLDITSYYYNACADFDSLFFTLANKEPDFKNYSYLTGLVKRIYENYNLKLKVLCDRKLSDLPIPIGLVSSGFFGNYALSNFDVSLNELEDVELANRYVDDILILVKNNVGKTFDELIRGTFHNLFLKSDTEKNIYYIRETNFVIKNDKIRLFDIKHNSSDYILLNLQKEIFRPSGVKLFPKYVSNFEQLYDRSILDNKTLKIRENIQKPNINPSKLAGSLSGYLLMQNGAEEDNSLQVKTSNSILSLFDSNIVLSATQRWDKIISFFISLKHTLRFKKLTSFISSSIRKVSLPDNSNLSKECLKSLKKNLYELLEISIAESLAPYGEKKLITEDYCAYKELALKLRNANLFDHNLVSFPLAELFVSNLEDDLTTFNARKHLLSNIDYEGKVRLFPRFIHLDEYLYYQQCLSIFSNSIRSFNYQKAIDNYNEKILVYFSFKPEPVSIISDKTDEYLVHKVKLTNPDMDDENIAIALANIDLSKHKLTKNAGYKTKLNKLNGTVKQKSILIDLLNACFYNKIKVKKNEKEDQLIPAKFLVFPEFYLPIEWVGLVSRFVRKTKTTVVTGLKPLKIGKQILNLQAVIVPFRDVYGHSNSLVFIREKNNYAPLEKQIYKNSFCTCQNALIPQYFLFDDTKTKFAPYICYELTDVRARSLFKNEVDIIISSEFNEDIYYFSNIVESTARDLNCFVVQVNSSNYGDSRIVAPYRDKFKEIVSITGGIKDTIHMGIIDLVGFKRYMDEFRFCDLKSDYKDITPTYTSKTKCYKKFKKPSAGIK